MIRFLNNGTTVDSKTDINYSTRYDDRELINRPNEHSKLDWLTSKINMEIQFSSDNVLKLERLQQQYHADGLEAKADNNMAYYMRYAQAYERLNIIIEARYRKFKPVSDKGKQDDRELVA